MFVEERAGRRLIVKKGQKGTEVFHETEIKYGFVREKMGDEAKSPRPWGALARAGCDVEMSNPLHRGNPPHHHDPTTKDPAKFELALTPPETSRSSAESLRVRLARLPSILAPSKKVASVRSLTDSNSMFGEIAVDRGLPPESAGCCRFWCSTQGCVGVTTVVIWAILLLFVTVLLVFHCTDAISEMISEEHVRTDYLHIDTTVQVITGILCCVFAVYSLVGLVIATCAWRPLILKRAFKGRPTSRFRVVRAYFWCREIRELGGAWFHPFEFAKELLEFCLQVVALTQYAEAGFSRVFLAVHGSLILINSLAALGHAVPSFAIKRPVAALLADAVFDTVYALLPLGNLMFEVGWWW